MKYLFFLIVLSPPETPLFQAVPKLFILILLVTQVIATLLLLSPIFWSSLLLLPLFFLVLHFYDQVGKKKDKKYLYYAITTQAISIFTVSGVILGFFSGLTWNDQFFSPPSNSTCTTEDDNVHSVGLPLYLTGIFLHIVSIILFFVIIKYISDCMKRIEEVERG